MSAYGIVCLKITLGLYEIPAYNPWILGRHASSAIVINSLQVSSRISTYTQLQWILLSHAFLIYYRVSWLTPINTLKSRGFRLLNFLISRLVYPPPPPRRMASPLLWIFTKCFSIYRMLRSEKSPLRFTKVDSRVSSPLRTTL